MEDGKYDVFISYRRITGKNYARVLKPELEKRGFSVFLDFDELKDGVFDQRIKDAIENAPVFLVILSEGALDRCINEGDWVREEIIHANKTKRHIVPVEVDKSFREVPKETPEEIKQILGAHLFSQIDTETLLQVSLDKMVKERIEPYVEKRKEGSSSNNSEQNISGAEIHIETDADCDLFRFKKLIASLQANQDTVIHLIPGEHRLTFVSKQCPDIKLSQTYTVPSENYSGIITVSLSEKIRLKLQEEEIRRREEERRRMAKEAEVRRMAEEEAKKQREKREREEALRRAEEEKLRKQAEERTKLEEERKRLAEQRSRAEEEIRCREEEMKRMAKEAEVRRMAEEEAKKQREKREREEALRRAEEEKLRKQAEERKKLEEERKRWAEQRSKAEEEIQGGEKGKNKHKAIEESENFHSLSANLLPFTIRNIEIHASLRDSVGCTRVWPRIYYSALKSGFFVVDVKIFGWGEGGDPSTHFWGNALSLSIGEGFKDLNGPEAYGHWTSGSYRIQIWYQGTLMAEQVFQLFLRKSC